MKTKQLFLLRSCLLPLIVSCIVAASHGVRADPITLTRLIVGGDPEIPCDGSSTYGLLLRGGGSAGTTFKLTYTVFGLSGHEPSEVQLNPPNTIDITIGEDGQWSRDVIFTLHCVGCIHVEGFSSLPITTGEAIFVRVSLTGNPVQDSNQLVVSCTHTPEPTTIILLGTGLAVIRIKTRKRFKRPKGRH